MRFDKLHEHIPLARYGKAKSLTMQPYEGITLAMPGRHAEDTTPKGGDFVVMVDDIGLGWKKHQFKHDDIFKDIEAKAQSDQELTTEFLEKYLEVIATGVDPAKMYKDVPDPISGLQDSVWEGTIHPNKFLKAIQCLAVAEHRRYNQWEAQYGGRFLPFRFAAGIAEGLWTAQDAIEKQRYGRPAVERLERAKGTPVLTKELMNL